MRTLPLLALLSLVAAAPAPFTDHPVNQWVKQSPRPDKPVPKFGWEGSAAFDPHNNRWIHHAGHDGNPQGFITFTYDLSTATWKQLFPPTSPPGVCCVDGANVFDAANRCFVRFPGGSLGHGYQWSRSVRLKESPVWLFDAATNEWTNMRPPPYADASRTRDAIGGLCPAGAYDPSRGLAISFGGGGSVGAKNNLHFYDAHANQLHLVKPRSKDDPWPSPRDGCGLAYDANHDKLVLFGGQYTDDERTWVFDMFTQKWEAHDLTPRPPGLKGKNTYSTIPKMTYDAANGVILCVIWLDEKRGHETWALDLSAMKWTNTNPTTHPENSKSRSRNLDFNARDNVAILETWTVNSEPQLWTYRYREAAARVSRPQDVKLVTAERSAKLTWAAVPGAVSYTVFRGEGADPLKVRLQRLADTRETTFDDPTVAPGAVYTYVVQSIGAEGVHSPFSFRVRTQPRVIPSLRPVVSVLAEDRVEISWPAHPAADIVGYNLYRGRAAVRTVKKGTPAAWKDNDPEYPEPVIAGVTDIENLTKLNDRPLTQTTFADPIDLTKDPAADYRFAAHAYVVRAVNRLGVEGGPSPYALTVPAEPTHVLCRENGQDAELKWTANLEKNLTGYHVYKMEGGVFGIKRITDAPLKQTNFTHRAGKDATRYWITAVDALGQEGQPSSPAWFGRSYKGFFDGEWHQ